MDVKDKKKIQNKKKNPTGRVKFVGASRPETRTFLYRPNKKTSRPCILLKKKKIYSVHHLSVSVDDRGIKIGDASNDHAS